MTIAERIATYVRDTRLEDFDAAVVDYAKDLCVSSIGSAVLGAGMGVPRQLAD